MLSIGIPGEFHLPFKFLAVFFGVPCAVAVVVIVLIWRKIWPFR